MTIAPPVWFVNVWIDISGVAENSGQNYGPFPNSDAAERFADRVVKTERYALAQFTIESVSSPREFPDAATTRYDY